MNINLGNESCGEAEAYYDVRHDSLSLRFGSLNGPVIYMDRIEATALCQLIDKALRSPEVLSEFSAERSFDTDTIITWDFSRSSTDAPCNTTTGS